MNLIRRDILPIWQEVGQSTHNIARLVSEKLNTKTSHTGTLDPMASGVVIILAGETRLKKYEYAHWLKEYEFEMVLGMQTDTLDGMGLLVVNACNNSDGLGVPIINRESILEVLASLVGEYSQTVPIYSALKVQGKPLHQHARGASLALGMLTPVLPVRSGKILNLELLNIRKISLSSMIENIRERINKVTGDFRQKEILQGWDEVATKWANVADTARGACAEVTLLKIKVLMTKGLYVRSLSLDIAKKLGTVGFAYSITRTKNGDYDKSTCIPLGDIC